MDTSTDIQEGLEKLRDVAKLEKRKRRFFSATQLVWAELERAASHAALLRTYSASTPGNHEIFSVCLEQLSRVKDCIDRPQRRSWAFWELLHEVDETLLLVTPTHMLGAEALSIVAKFRKRITDEDTRTLWLGTDGAPGPLLNAANRWSKRNDGKRAGIACDGHGPGDALADRVILQSALRLVNRQGDRTFWRLGTNVAIQVMSAGVLAILLGVVMWQSPRIVSSFESEGPSRSWQLGIGATAALGGCGAIISNMWRKDALVASVGATSRYYLYNLFAKPVIGAFAAIFLLLIERSGLLFQVISKGADTQAPIQIVVGKEGIPFTRAVIAVVAGYSAEKVVKSTVGKVFANIFTQAERTTAPPVATRAESN